MEHETRCGFVAIIGAPNAGKSTLLNALVGAKISIVSRKVQTTRARVRAIFIAETAQVILVDTPGIFAPRRKLDEAMVDAAWHGAAQADAILLMVDASRGLTADAEHIVTELAARRLAANLALNKIDLVRRDRLLGLSRALNDMLGFAATFMISAAKGDGVDGLKRHLAAAMPPGPWLYPGDQIADLPLRLLAAEITREKMLDRLHQELPYESTVETERWEERSDGSVRIDQVVYVQREGQRKIVLGEGGQTIKTIGQLARHELREQLERPVHLFLFVKVRENWASDPERLRAMGLDP
ncbi:MAG: GTPase Era [Pseudomonadota bacterium]|nr:GTPase Era [Pseudomonadota bacterium]